MAALIVAGPIATGLAIPAIAAPLPQSSGCIDYDDDGYCDDYTDDSGDYDFPEPTPVCVPSPYGCPGD